MSESIKIWRPAFDEDSSCPPPPSPSRVEGAFFLNDHLADSVTVGLGH